LTKTNWRYILYSAFLFSFKGVVIKGTICRIESKDYYVFPDKGKNLIRCSIKGKFKKEFNLKKEKLFKTDIAVVGDRVEFDINEDKTGVIHKIEKRKNYLSRKAPKIKGAGYRGERLEQVIAANIDNLFIISSVSQPEFNNKVIDRFLVIAESSNINPYIIINKIDIDNNNSIEYWENLYKLIGYEVLKTTIYEDNRTDELKELIKNKRSLFWGQSGVGKSSLLNEMYPDIDLETGDISNYTDKGKHTTVTSIMLEIDPETFIIDTPGIREIDPFGIRKQDLSHYFIEFYQFSIDCKFNTCTHYHEPGCKVIEAVENGQISAERYDSYLRILDTIEEDIVF